MQPRSRFDLLLTHPDAYLEGERVAGFCARPRKAAGTSSQAPAPAVSPSVSIGLVQKPNRLARKVRGRATKATRLARRGARMAVRMHPARLTISAVKKAGKAVAAASTAVRRKIFGALFRKLVTRRALLLAYGARRSMQPNAIDRREAHAWARAYVARKGILGRLVAAALAGEVGTEPVTSSLLTASVPVLLSLARRALAAAEREGAPADPRSTPVHDARDDESGAVPGELEDLGGP